MLITCLIVKSYKGTPVKRQREIVTELAFKQVGIYLWDLTVPDDVECIRSVERTLAGRVPFLKNNKTGH